MGGAVLGRDGAAGFGFRAGGMEGIGAVGGELCVRDRSDGFGSFGRGCDDGRLGCGCWHGCWNCSGEAGFAGELAVFVRGGTAFFAVHINVDPCEELEMPLRLSWLKNTSRRRGGLYDEGCSWRQEIGGKWLGGLKL